MAEPALRDPRRPRHWKQRFDPAMRFVFRRATNYASRAYKPGDPIPEELATHKGRLRRLWNARRIQLEWCPNSQTGTRFPPELRHQKIIEAIGQLDPDNPELWTKSNPPKPKVEAIEAILGFDISGLERDQGFEAWQAAQEA